MLGVIFKVACLAGVVVGGVQVNAADRSHLKGPGGEGIFALVDALQALGWSSTSELSGMYHAGDIFQMGGADGSGDRLWSGSCFDVTPRDEAFVGSDVSTTLSAGVTVPLGVAASIGSGGSLQRRVVFASPRHQAVAMTDLVPTERCIDNLERFARAGEDVTILQVLQEVLRATISEQTIGKVDAKGSFVTVDVTLSGGSAQTIASEGPVTVGVRTVSVSQLPGLENLTEIVRTSRDLLAREPQQPVAERQLQLVPPPKDVPGVIHCPDIDTFHTHLLANTTRPAPGHESYLIGHAFRIYIDDAAISLIDIDSLQCSSPSGWVSCAEGHSDGYGGTQVRYVTDSLENPKAPSRHYVEWTYGNDQRSKKPMVPGFNDYDGNRAVDNTSDQRDFGETLGLFFKPEAEGRVRTWSATYIQFWDYDREGCGRFSDQSCWTPVLDEGVTTKHWTFVSNIEQTSRLCAQ